jgi:hypothetical protein
MFENVRITGPPVVLSKHQAVGLICPPTTTAIIIIIIITIIMMSKGVTQFTTHTPPPQK